MSTETNRDPRTGNFHAYSPIGLRHVIRMTDSRGILEHANGTTPRYSHGYCTDDNARLLIVTARDEGSTAGSEALAQIAMRFILDAQLPDGTILNRMSFARIWTDSPSTDDCWGRAMWAYGTAAGQSTNALLRDRGLAAFEISAKQESRWLRSNCFAALGAAEILKTHPHHQTARRVLDNAAQRIPDHSFDPPAVQNSASLPKWSWPERKLTYANAIVPEVLIASGQHLNNREHLVRGLHLLDWLVQGESLDGHLSVTPTGGRKHGDVSPAFDQQPIEVAALADALWRAAAVTKDPRWLKDFSMCVNWFHGDNDKGISMIDHESHGGFDGLTHEGVNLNQGAESTLAMIATLQSRRLS